jgi:hypothetical protein
MEIFKELELENNFWPSERDIFLIRQSKTC